MTKKNQIIALSVVALIMLGAYLYKHQPGSVPKVTQPSSSVPLVRQDETDTYSIHVEYPVVDEALPGAQAANASMKQDIDARIAAFEKEATDSTQNPIDLPKEVKSTVAGSPSTEYETDRYVSLFFGSEWYVRGAAHPYHMIFTYVFDKKLGKLVTIQDFFLPYSKYFQFLSAYAYGDLKSQEGDLGFEFDEQMLRSGTEATLENFRHALPTKDGLMIYFDEYQVAPYAAGPQQIAVPYAKLKEFIDPQGVLGTYK
jgi:hypothetical protein